MVRFIGCVTIGPAAFRIGMAAGAGAGIWLASTGIGLVLAEDRIYLRPDPPGGAAARVEGEIVDFTGRALMLSIPGSSRPKQYPAERIERIETSWPAAYESGRSAMAEHDYQAAADQFQAAAGAESRAWARRTIWADLVSCHRALGQDARAGDLFLAILESDPSSPAWDQIPLAWFPTESVPPAKAKQWFANAERPVSVLLGASYLLATRERDAAVARLRQLAGQRDAPRIAGLAEAQLWRIEVVTVDARDLARWRVRIDALPNGLRAGPYYLLAQALERHDRPADAALAYLRVVIHDARDRPLAARALIGAARSTYDSGHAEDACRLLRELIRDFPNTPERSEAEQMLKRFLTPLTWDKSTT